MISCSNCGKSVADDAVHCGHCGHKLEPATSQKTMMGFSLSPEDLQKAIAEAGQQRAAQSIAPPQEDSIDGMARTEILPSIDSSHALSDTLDPESDLATEAGHMAGNSSFGTVPEYRAPAPTSDPFGSFAGAPSAQDPFSQSSPGVMNHPISPMPQSSMQNLPAHEGGEQSFVEKNKKLLMIAGGVFLVLFLCCIISAIVQFAL